MMVNVAPKLKKMNDLVNFAMMLVATEFIMPWIISKTAKTPTICNLDL
jgi:hypothetical protein